METSTFVTKYIAQTLVLFPISENKFHVPNLKLKKKT